MFFFEKLCDTFLTCHDKEFVVSTQTSAFLEVACITPHPQLYPECQRKHDFLDKEKHIYREKKFLNEICGDSPPFTHPHFFSNSLLYMGLHKITWWISEVLMIVFRKSHCMNLQNEFIGEKIDMQVSVRISMRRSVECDYH